MDETSEEREQWVFLTGIKPDARVPACLKGTIREVDHTMFMPLQQAKATAEGGELPYGGLDFNPEYGLYIPCDESIGFPFQFKRDDLLRFLLFFEVATVLNKGACARNKIPGVWICFHKLKHGLLLYMKVTCDQTLLLGRKILGKARLYDFHTPFRGTVLGFNEERKEIEANGDGDGDDTHAAPIPPPPLAPGLGPPPPLLENEHGELKIPERKEAAQEVKATPQRAYRKSLFYATVNDACRFLCHNASPPLNKLIRVEFNNYMQQLFSQRVYSTLFNEYMSHLLPRRGDVHTGAFTQYFYGEVDSPVSCDTLFDVYTALNLAYQDEMNRDEMPGYYGAIAGGYDGMDKRDFLRQMMNKQDVMILFPCVVDDRDQALVIPLTLTCDQIALLNIGLSLANHKPLPPEIAATFVPRYAFRMNGQLEFGGTTLNYNVSDFVDMGIEQLRKACFALLRQPTVSRMDVFKVAWTVLSTSSSMPPNVRQCMKILDRYRGKKIAVCHDKMNYTDLSVFGNVKVWYQGMIETVSAAACNHDLILLCILAHLSNYDFREGVMHLNLALTGPGAGGKSTSVGIATQCMVPNTTINFNGMSARACQYPSDRGISGKHVTGCFYGLTVIADEGMPGTGVTVGDTDKDQVIKASMLKSMGTGARFINNVVVNMDTRSTDKMKTKQTLQMIMLTNEKPDRTKALARRFFFYNVPAEDLSHVDRRKKHRHVNRNFSDLRNENVDNEERFEVLHLIEAIYCAIDCLIYLGLLQEVEHEAVEAFSHKYDDIMEKQMKTSLLTSGSQRVGILGRVFSILTAATTFTFIHSLFFSAFDPLQLFLTESMLVITFEMAMTAVSYLASDFVDPTMEMVCRGLYDLCRSIDEVSNPPNLIQQDREITLSEIERVVKRHNASAVIGRLRRAISSSPSLSSSSSSSSSSVALLESDPNLNLNPNPFTLAARNPPLVMDGAAPILNNDQALRVGQIHITTQILDALLLHICAQNPSNIQSQAVRNILIDLQSRESLMVNGHTLKIDRALLQPDAQHLLRRRLEEVVINFEPITEPAWLCVHPRSSLSFSINPRSHTYVLGYSLSVDIPDMSDYLNVVHLPADKVPPMSRTIPNLTYIRPVILEDSSNVFEHPHSSSSSSSSSSVIHYQDTRWDVTNPSHRLDRNPTLLFLHNRTEDIDIGPDSILRVLLMDPLYKFQPDETLHLSNPPSLRTFNPLFMWQTLRERAGCKKEYHKVVMEEERKLLLALPPGAPVASKRKRAAELMDRSSSSSSASPLLENDENDEENENAQLGAIRRTKRRPLPPPQPIPAETIETYDTLYTPYVPGTRASSSSSSAHSHSRLISPDVVEEDEEAHYLTRMSSSTSSSTSSTPSPIPFIHQQQRRSSSPIQYEDAKQGRPNDDDDGGDTDFRGWVNQVDIDLDALPPPPAPANRNVILEPHVVRISNRLRYSEHQLGLEE